MPRISLALIALLILVSSSVNAQRKKIIPPEKPKLIVGIIVEDMRYDYIDRFWNNFSDNGFKKLITEGSFCRNANYNYLLTQTSSGIATISTGCEPVIHGIVSDKWYNQLKNTTIRSVYDNKVNGIDDEKEKWKCSPKHLLTTTFVDELKLYNNNSSKAIGISVHPEGAILPIGHMGDAAYWFNDENGNWTSSNFYMDSLPLWVNNFNSKKIPDLYNEREWTPSMELSKYRAGATQGSNRTIGFSDSEKLTKKLNALLKKEAEYSKINSTPYGVSLTKDFAIATIINEDLGKDLNTDFLNICFSSTSIVSGACGPNSIELEDMYIKLDKELEHLFQFLDNEIGRENVLIYITSDHGTSYNPQDLINNNIPAGQFDGDRAIMLLGTYLNAIYDKGKWVSAYHNKQIYLNHNLIEKSEISIGEFQKTVADFIIQFSGVANAITASTLEQTNFTHGIFNHMQNSFNQKRSGDIIINLEPGWIEKGKYISTANSSNKYDIHVPLIWYGWKIKRSRIEEEVMIKDIAPTISNFLEIPYPNGCTGVAIDGLVK